MRVKCSWCKKTLVFDDSDDSVSHGICLPCGMKNLEDAGVDPKMFFTQYIRGKQPKRIYSDEDNDDADRF